MSSSQVRCYLAVRRSSGHPNGLRRVRGCRDRVSVTSDDCRAGPLVRGQRPSYTGCDGCAASYVPGGLRDTLGLGSDAADRSLRREVLGELSRTLFSTATGGQAASGCIRIMRSKIVCLSGLVAHPRLISFRVVWGADDEGPCCG